MHGEIGLVFPQGKRAAIVRRYQAFVFFFFSLCAEFSYFHTTGCGTYPFATDGYGIFNVRKKNWVRAVHTKGGQAQTSLHSVEFGGTETKLFLSLLRQGIEPSVFGFEFRLCNH